MAPQQDSVYGTDGFGTKAIHVGQEPERWDMNQVVPCISLSTTYKQERPGEPKGHDYSRAGNPTRDVLQENIAALENGANILKTGDHIVCSDDVYGGQGKRFSF
uniref:cystathionine gamma-lyase n=1 Tax=Panagrolaimus davidi TaxID=227884 RepID=A0A914QMT0_9BILA